jgi:creatinine amidohydrolase
VNELGLLNWQEFGRRVPAECDSVLLPVGTIEAHGVTPLATDNLIPEYLCRRLADDLGALVAPTVPYGITRSLAGFPGSFGVQPETLRLYMIDVLMGLAGAGFKRIAVINGHGGNNAVLKDAAYEAFQRTGVKVAVVHWWVFCYDVCRDVFGQNGGHAGCDETAMVFAANPEWVRQDLYRPDLAFTYHSAVDIYPAPSSVMLYTPGEGEPVFDAELCTRYAEAALDKVRDFLFGLWRAWDRMLEPAGRPR